MNVCQLYVVCASFLFYFILFLFQNKWSCNSWTELVLWSLNSLKPDQFKVQPVIQTLFTTERPHENILRIHCTLQSLSFFTNEMNETSYISETQEKTARTWAHEGFPLQTDFIRNQSTGRRQAAAIYSRFTLNTDIVIWYLKICDNASLAQLCWIYTCIFLRFILMYPHIHTPSIRGWWTRSALRCCVSRGFRQGWVWAGSSCSGKTLINNTSNEQTLRREIRTQEQNH